MSRQVRFGILGAGQISRTACQEINRHPHASVTAASDPSAQRLAKLADRAGGIRTFADNESLLNAPDIDVVYIATPNAFHAPLAVSALRAGKHVLVEKPFTTNVTEALEVVRESQRAGKLLSVGMDQRFRPESQRIAELVRAGKLGHIYHVKAFWQRRTGIPKLGSWFGHRAHAGGGALYDIGVHLLDLALFVMNRFDPVSVSGQTYSTFGPRGIGEGGWGYSERAYPAFDVDDAATAWLRFSDGATLTLDVNWAAHQRDADRMNVIIQGTEAGAGCYPGELYRFGREPGTYEMSTLPLLPLPYPHANRFHQFVEAILGNEPLCVVPEQAVAVQRILDAIYESSRLGREVTLDHT